MATSLATMKKTAPTTPHGCSFPLPAPADRMLKIVSKQVDASPEPEAKFDLQSPLNKLVAGRSRREYRAGEAVFSQGDPANAVFYLQSGKVKLTVVSVNGKEAVIAHHPAGCF